MSSSEEAGRAEDLRYSATREELAPFVPVTAARLLDIGCGTGGFGMTLRRLDGEQRELWGVEPVAAAADLARGVYDEVRTGFFPDPSMDLPHGYFDAVFLLDVLEHMVEPEAALRALHPLVAENGVVVASIPNARHFDVWWPLVRHGRWTYTETGLMDRTHLRWFTRSSMREMFERCGWQVDGLIGINRSEPVGWKAKALATLGRQTDEMFSVQFVVTARAL
jgi:2-polyprenyl-3-methyl-5-hydroxy-6-metoxy-1,4-benzoquinol methylase